MPICRGDNGARQFAQINRNHRVVTAKTESISIDSFEKHLKKRVCYLNLFGLKYGFLRSDRKHISRGSMYDCLGVWVSNCQ